MKFRVLQLLVELKSTKKGNKSIIEFILKIKAIANSLLADGDSITMQDQINSILDGLPEEYNLFVMQIYGSPASLSLSDVEELLYVQEPRLDKFCHELFAFDVTANLAHTSQ